jgi:hypothetical protein
VRSGLLSRLAFDCRDLAFAEVGVHAQHGEYCECCGSLIWLLEYQCGARRWVDLRAAPEVDVSIVSLEWVEHDRPRCERARARGRARGLVGGGAGV